MLIIKVGTKFLSSPQNEWGTIPKSPEIIRALICAPQKEQVKNGFLDFRFFLKGMEVEIKNDTLSKALKLESKKPPHP